MQEKFNHTPLAVLLQQRTKKLAQTGQSAAFQTEQVSPNAMPAMTLSAPLQEDGNLFLQAMESLVAEKNQHKNKAKSQKHSLHQASHKVFTLAETEKSGQFLHHKPSKKPKKSLKKALCAQEQSINSVKPNTFPHIVEETLTMQDMLQAQEAQAKGEDVEGVQAFFNAMKEVSPLTGKGRDIAPEVMPAPSAQQGQNAFALMLEKKLEFSLALKGEYIEGHVVGLDELTMNNLRAGVYSPEAHLDLHGLNAQQAYEAMVGFFRGSWYKGMRTLLLIPGRGKNSPNGVSVLREKVQLWLTQEPFKRVVLAFCTAQPVDGGPGTIYVLVRKYKKKGKICWERLPSDPDLY